MSDKPHRIGVWLKHSVEQYFEAELMLPEGKTLSDIDPDSFRSTKARIMFRVDGVEYEQFIEKMQVACSEGLPDKIMIRSKDQNWERYHEQDASDRNSAREYIDKKL